MLVVLVVVVWASTRRGWRTALLAATKQLARKSTKTDFQKQEATAATLPLTDVAPPPPLQ